MWQPDSGALSVIDICTPIHRAKQCCDAAFDGRKRFIAAVLDEPPSAMMIRGLTSPRRELNFKHEAAGEWVLFILPTVFFSHDPPSLLLKAVSAVRGCCMTRGRSGTQPLFGCMVNDFPGR